MTDQEEWKDPGEEESPQDVADKARIQAAITTLMEHFDSVQIFCTRFDGNGSVGGKGAHKTTRNWHRGDGNYWAIMGQIAIWLKCQEKEMTITED